MAGSWRFLRAMHSQQILQAGGFPYHEQAELLMKDVYFGYFKVDILVKFICVSSRSDAERTMIVQYLVGSSD